MIRSGILVTFLLHAALAPAQQYNYDYPAISSVQAGEKVWLHIDRDIYHPAEDIWFRAYVIDFLTNKPSENTNNLHVDLISPEAQIMQHKILRIVNGLGNGDFSLGDSLPSGRYIIRAYTNHMRNHGEEFFFKKEIVVINPDQPLPPVDTVRYSQNVHSFDFFPESGSLVVNVPSVVAFKAVNEKGQGVNIRGRIFTKTGKYIAWIESKNLGMGVFLLKPVYGEEYYLLAEGPDETSYRVDLPVIFPEGVVIHAFTLPDNKLMVKILTNDYTLSSLENKDFQLTISTRNLYASTIRLRLNSTTSNFSIPLDNFPEGVLKLTLSDEEGKPVAERLIFNQKEHNLKISISTDRHNYDLRDPVTADIALSGNENTRAFLSFSAADAQMSADTSFSPSNIASWFLLESEVKGFIENPGSYFDPSNEKRLEHLDLLLLTQGWRDFAWKYDGAGRFEHEIGFSLRGNVRKALNGKPFPLAKVNIAVFDEKKSFFRTEEADSSGNFHAGKLDLDGRARILVSSANQKNSLTGWIILDSMFYEPPAVLSGRQRTSDLLPARFVSIYEEERDFDLYRKKFKLSDTLEIGEVFVTARKREQVLEMNLRSSRALYGKPDREFILLPQHYQYAELSQVMAGKIAGVEVSTAENKVSLRGQTPLLLIDGIPVGNELAPGGAALPNLTPSEIERIDVLYWSSPYGSKGANGVINFITRRGDFNYEEVNYSHSKYITCKGFDAPRIFYSPKYESKYYDGQTPDFRNTIFWSPDIQTDLNGKTSVNFFNSDKAGIISIRVEGISSGGIPLTASYKYTVGNPSALTGNLTLSRP